MQYPGALSGGTTRVARLQAKDAGSWLGSFIDALRNTGNGGKPSDSGPVPPDEKPDIIVIQPPEDTEGGSDDSDDNESVNYGVYAIGGFVIVAVSLAAAFAAFFALTRGGR